VQKIIRALALVYACCVSDDATARAASIVVDGGSRALIVPHPSAVASLIEEPAASEQ
jgi:hypothetical protein